MSRTIVCLPHASVRTGPNIVMLHSYYASQPLCPPRAVMLLCLYGKASHRTSGLREHCSIVPTDTDMSPCLNTPVHRDGEYYGSGQQAGGGGRRVGHIDSCRVLTMNSLSISSYLIKSQTSFEPIHFEVTQIIHNVCIIYSLCVHNLLSLYA